MSAKAVKSLFGGKNYQYTSLGQVQNTKKGNVYVFGDDDVAEDEIVEFEMDTVRARKAKHQNKKQEEDCPSYIERRLTEDDTLQSVALQYGCPVSEIKRLNNLIRDQDFYALTSVKIPVKQHSFLVDKIKEDDRLASEALTKSTVKRSLSNGAACVESADDQSVYYDSETDPAADLSDPDTQRQVIHKISISRVGRSQTREAQKFLKNMDKDLSHILKSTRTERSSLNEVISVLTRESVNPLAMPPKRKSKYMDWAMEWRTTVVILVIISVVVPLAIIIIYFTYYSK